MKWLNYHHFIYFREIAIQGSVSRAAEVLKVGQPALSEQLKQLELSLKVQLFERKGRRLVLTDAGRLALEYAKRVYDLGQEFLAVIEEEGGEKQSKIGLGALDSIPKHLISDIMDFTYKEKGCFFSVYEDSIDMLLDQMRKHNLDLIISDHELIGLELDNIFSKKILRRPVVAFAAPSFLGLRDNFPASLHRAPCILPTRHSRLRSDIENYFHQQNISPKIIAETQDTSLQKILATKGDGIVFLPDFASNELIQNRRFIRIGEMSNLYCEYYFIYSKRHIKRPVVEFILNKKFEEMQWLLPIQSEED